MQFIFDCSCIETDTGRPAYSEPPSLHKNYIKKSRYYIFDFRTYYFSTEIIRVKGYRLSKRGSGSKIMAGNPPGIENNRKPSDIRIDFCPLSKDIHFHMQFFSCNIYNESLVAGT